MLGAAWISDPVYDYQEFQENEWYGEYKGLNVLNIKNWAWKWGYW